MNGAANIGKKVRDGDRERQEPHDTDIRLSRYRIVAPPLLYGHEAMRGTASVCALSTELVAVSAVALARRQSSQDRPVRLRSTRSG